MCTRLLTLSLAGALLLALAAPRLASAAWPHNPGTNVPLCTAANQQLLWASGPDGAGGAIVTWIDQRSGGQDIYAQHVLFSGAVDPAWPVDGRALCTAANTQQYPTIVSDGAGGAIVTWQDLRSGTTLDIYAQHVMVTGAVDPAWPADGRALRTAANHQQYPTLVSDGAGGAIATWYDLRGGATYDIYAQRVLASGAVDPAWPADGRALCTAANSQQDPVIVSDGAGGAIVAWDDNRGASTDIYAQHVLSAGTVDPAWPADGRALCTAANGQTIPRIMADGAGGAIVTWYDSRGASRDIYAQHVLASGAVDGAWPADGRALCTAANDQFNPFPVSDGSGGAIVTWYDFRPGATSDIYAQHVLASGAVDPAWPADGRALCTAAGNQQGPSIVSDGAGGAIVAWSDLRGGTFDVYAHHVLASGAVDPGWPADGLVLSNAAGNQTGSPIVSDGAGGAVVAWQDQRSGDNDIYAQRVARFGYLGTPEPVIASVRDVANDQGGEVNVAWDASWLDTDPSAVVDHYWILRSLTQSGVEQAPRTDARPLSAAAAETIGGGDRDAILTTIEGSMTYYWQYLASVAALHIVEGYGYVAPTTGDSTGASNPPSYFMVVAWNATGTKYWASPPDSGYSVDNLPPLAPAPFAGQYNAGVATLHWNPNIEPDLAGYRLYRGGSADFVPGPGNLVATPTGTDYVDAAGAPYYYKLSAIDIHGNESGFALILPSGTADLAEPSLSRELALALPSPNPAFGRVTLRFALPREARVSLAIYDASGRRVRPLVDGVWVAGEYAMGWDLRDEAGHRAPAGLYFAQLEAEGHTLIRRIAALK